MNSVWIPLYPNSSKMIRIRLKLSYPNPNYICKKYIFTIIKLLIYNNLFFDNIILNRIFYGISVFEFGYYSNSDNYRLSADINSIRIWIRLASDSNLDIRIWISSKEIEFRISIEALCNVSQCILNIASNRLLISKQRIQTKEGKFTWFQQQ